MRPVGFRGCDHLLEAPEGMPEVQALPAQRLFANVVRSKWEPTPEERMAIAEGALVVLEVFSYTPHPPVAMYADREPREVER